MKEYIIYTISANLNYWSVELQEAYYSPVEVKIKYIELNKKK